MLISGRFYENSFLCTMKHMRVRLIRFCKIGTIQYSHNRLDWTVLEELFFEKTCTLDFFNIASIKCFRNFLAKVKNKYMWSFKNVVFANFVTRKISAVFQWKNNSFGNYFWQYGLHWFFWITLTFPFSSFHPDFFSDIWSFSIAWKRWLLKSNFVFKNKWQKC